MKPEPSNKQAGLSPLTIAVALGASAGVWVVVEILRRALQ